jgi:hypothetical protein
VYGVVVAVKPRSVSKRKALVSTIETRAEAEGGRERERERRGEQRWREEPKQEWKRERWE